MAIPSKPGAMGAIGGAVVLFAGTVLHPLQADPGDPVAAFTEYATDTLWIGSHLAQFFGMALMFFGLVAMKDSLSADRFQWLAELGVLVGVVALAATAVLQAVDGIALKAMVDGWANAPPEHKQTAFHAALAVRQIEVGLASLTALLFGVTASLYAIAVALGTTYPTWLGWFGLAGGLGTMAGGIVTAFAGFSTTAMNIAMPFNLALLVWVLIIGVNLWRGRRGTEDHHS